MIIGVFHLDPICYYTMLELNSSAEVLMELIVVYTNAQVIQECVLDAEICISATKQGCKTNPQQQSDGNHVPDCVRERFTIYCT